MKDKDSRHFIKGIPYTKIDKKIVLKDINNFAHFILA